MTGKVVSPQQKRRTQHERRSEAERKLVEAASELIAEQGAERTSLAQIGLKSGFSRGIVNHHFGTKADLITHIVNEVQGEFLAGMAGTEKQDGLDWLVSTIEHYFATVLQPGARYRAYLVLWAEAAGVGRELRPTFLEGDRRFRSGVKYAVERGITDGSIRANADSTSTAAMLVGQLRGLALEAIIDPDAFELDAVRMEMISALRASLAAANL